ncbi:MAG: hypothetical protein IPM02_20920 [Betaproteobacteria bacterium]|nr:hypothetical protein [Betaproteobacteria bacterium]
MRAAPMGAEQSGKTSAARRNGRGVSDLQDQERSGIVADSSCIIRISSAPIRV